MDQEEQARRPEPQLSALSARRAAYTRQSGWVGILAVLLALCIVAIMAGTLLRQYGLAGGTAPRAEQDARGGSAATTELVGGVAPPPVPDAVTPAPRDAI